MGASGGGDSTALLLMLAPVARAQGRHLVAGIVDHALREGSAADAARAAAITADLGAEPHILTLTWPDGPRTAQAAARTARYAALAHLAADVGAGTLFLGHTLNDQAETYALRRDAGSGPRGLAAMGMLSPCPVWPEGRDLALARPLLDWRRAELRACLRAHGVTWIEDPANALERYARVRVRATIGDTLAQTFAAEAARHTLDAAELDLAAEMWLTAFATVRDDTAFLDHAAAFDHPAAGRALAALTAACGGAIREPSPEAAGRLCARLAAGQDSTLSGAHFCVTANGVRARRDPGGLLGRRGGPGPIAPLPLPEGRAVVWDRRLALRADEPGWTAGPPATRFVLAPSLTRAGKRRPGVTRRWLVEDRLKRLLWRANCSLFTGA